MVIAWRHNADQTECIQTYISLHRKRKKASRLGVLRLIKMAESDSESSFYDEATDYQLEDDGNDGRVLAQPGIVVYYGVTLAAPPMFLHVFYLRKSLFCSRLNFLNFSRNSAWDFLKFFLTLTEINWLEWFAISLIILYTWIWIPSLIFWMQ